MGSPQPHFATTNEVSNLVNYGTQSYIDVTQISQAQGPYPSMPAIWRSHSLRVSSSDWGTDSKNI